MEQESQSPVINVKIHTQLQNFYNNKCENSLKNKVKKKKQKLKKIFFQSIFLKIKILVKDDFNNSFSLKQNIFNQFIINSVRKMHGKVGIASVQYQIKFVDEINNEAQIVLKQLNQQWFHKWWCALCFSGKYKLKILQMKSTYAKQQ